jgi:hypothetical protein
MNEEKKLDKRTISVGCHTVEKRSTDYLQIGFGRGRGQLWSSKKILKTL